MTEDERRALGLTRRLAFQNIAMGIPREQVMAELKLSQLEVDQAVAFVGKKITEYLVLRRQPPIDCMTIGSIRWHRKALLAVLSRIGDLDLSTQLTLGRVLVQAIDHPDMIEGAQHRMKDAYR